MIAHGGQTRLETTSNFARVNMMIDFPPAPPWALKLNPDCPDGHACVLRLDLDVQYGPQLGSIALVDSFFQLEGTLVHSGALVMRRTAQHKLFQISSRRVALALVRHSEPPGT